MILLRVLLLVFVLFVIPLAAHALWWAARDDLAPSWRLADL
jgi:hypothetical protein